MLPSHRLSYAAKVISAGVAVKAVLMGVLVSILAVTSFTKSIVLVLVSALATGVFGVMIVLKKAHAERSLHVRLDRLEDKATEAAQASTVAAEKTQVSVDAVTPPSDEAHS